jgi:hypothetical protein
VIEAPRSTSTSAPAPARPPVVLLGPQPDGGAQVAATLRELGVSGQVALITAGWQENEREDAALRAHIGLPVVNLALHARSEALFEDDPALAAAHNARQTLMQQIQACYRVRLEAADDAARMIAVRQETQALLDDELAVSIEVFRYLDREHTERCRRVHAEFREREAPEARPAYVAQVAEVEALLQDSEALVISGGHVGALLSRLNLFDVGELVARWPGRPVVAWSAGAMALTERVVCFHDFPPYGRDVAQVFDRGLGLAPQVVVLPDPRRRVRMGDVAGIARFTRRMAPASCYALDVGAALRFAAGTVGDGAAPQTTPRAFRLTETGRVEPEWQP